MKENILSFGRFIRTLLSDKYDHINADFRKKHGNDTFLLDWPLDENSIVFDLGGYRGQSVSDIYAKFIPYVYVFEPIYSDILVKRFKLQQKIKVFPFVLGSYNGETGIKVNEEGSSSFKQGIKVKVDTHSFKSFTELYSIGPIDLMQINIEGGEYELLEYLISSGYIEMIKGLQVQFHLFVPDAEKRAKEIREKLSKTHIPTFSYPFTWEGWKLK